MCGNMEDVCESVGDVCGNVIPYTEEGVLLCVCVCVSFIGEYLPFGV